MIARQLDAKLSEIRLGVGHKINTQLKIPLS